MENDIIVLTFKDMAYYDDNFNYKKYYILKEHDFEEKYSKLNEIYKNYEEFEEIEKFLKDNFKILNKIKEIEVCL